MAQKHLCGPTPHCSCAQIRLLYEAAPELELTEFFMTHGKLADAEATLRSFLADMKAKVLPDDSMWFRAHAVTLRLHCQQQLWGAAVSAGLEALACIKVRT